MVPRNNNNSTVSPKLDNSLLLNKFMLSLFGVSSFDELTSGMKDPPLERWDENNVSLFYQTIYNTFGQSMRLTKEQLLEYDGNIYHHTVHINRLRQDKIYWKYFQYLYLLFTEIYLDRYFSDAKQLAEEIEQFRAWNFQLDPNNYKQPFNSPITSERLHKLACWCATGAGKTLLMHVNILQIRHYAAKHGIRYDNTLLVTPKEGLSKQHLAEMADSDILSCPFTKRENDTMKGEFVQVIEITKLAETEGDTQVAVDSFEKKNLVFIDEGHRGTSGDTWKKMRDKLSEEGFCFEYSATFGQAIAAEPNGKKKDKLLNEYGFSTLFDYSYRYFYHDGYGKDFVTRNMNGNFTPQQENIYLTGGLLGFYEQIKLHADNTNTLMDFMIERPIAIFVGSTVSAKKSKQEISDIVRIVKFFSDFVSSPTQMATYIENLINGTDGLIDGNGKPVYKEAFAYLRKNRASGTVIYHDMLRIVFNNDNPGARLHVDNIKGVEGEIGLRLGNADYFGVINVGTPKNVVDACSEFAIAGPRDYSQQSLFDGINSKESKINVLIGAKKFTEGWSSWRVATMCLLNVGTGDGSEIIQLFGRGVRLKGYRFSLKRTKRLDQGIRPDTIPQHIELIETLNIFGIKADYMDEFSKIIKAEGVGNDDNNSQEITLPIMPNIVDIQEKRLKYLRIKKGKSFVRDVPDVKLNVDRFFYENQIVIDKYAHIKAFASDDISVDTLEAEKNTVKIDNLHGMNYVNWTDLYFDLLEYKRERGWYNLLISYDTVQQLASDPNWYILYMPESDLVSKGYRDSQMMWQQTLTAMLKVYIDNFYKKAKSEWMSHNLEVTTLTPDDTDYNSTVQMKIRRELYDNFKETLMKLKKQLADKSFAKTIKIAGGFEALYFARHLYSPLMYYNRDIDKNNLIEISPVALNQSERNFVNALMDYTNKNPQILCNHELYLLRNKSKTGIGFFDGTGFYPDFILWIVIGRKQYVTFIDPHGLVHAKNFEDEKINLHNTLHDKIQKEIKDDNIVLNSFILSPTPYGKVQHWIKPIKRDATIAEGKKIFHNNHVFFMQEDLNYIEEIIGNIIL